MKDFKRTDLLFSLGGPNCGLEHGGIEYCSQCQEFPCAEYETIDESDALTTHINRRRDMEKNRNIGGDIPQKRRLWIFWHMKG